MARNRVIYQSEALFAGQKSTRTTIVNAHTHSDIHQIHRVQSANYSFNIARTDVNQFGELAAIDRVALETPTVSLDFTYLLANFSNEEHLGFKVNDYLIQNQNLVKFHRICLFLVKTVRRQQLFCKKLARKCFSTFMMRLTNTKYLNYNRIFSGIFSGIF